MKGELIAVPYDSGRRGMGMGGGPERLLCTDLTRQLDRAGHDIDIQVLEMPAEVPYTEVGSTFHLAGAVASAVRRATKAGAFPVVLSGNCAPAAIGSIAGLGQPGPVYWFDAHGDFNTPETTESGFLDGMALAILTGRCWSRLAGAVPGFAPVPESSVVLLGARDLDAGEAAALRDSDVSRIAVAELGGELPGVVTRRHAPGRPAYLHIDLDVLDPAEARANAYAAPNGFSGTEVESAVRTIVGAVPVGAASLTAYDPDHDTNGDAAEAAIRLIMALVEAVAQKAPSGTVL